MKTTSKFLLFIILFFNSAKTFSQSFQNRLVELNNEKLKSAISNYDKYLKNFVLEN
jgi:hypothetical protein